MKNNDKENFYRRGNDDIDACVRIYGVCIGGVTSGDWTYTVNDDETTATIKYNGSSTGTVTIPETIDGKTVTAIGDSAFYYKKITGVEIPDTVVSIGTAAFRGASALKSVVLPSGMKTLGSNAFQQCSALESITIPNTLETIGTNAFYMCYALKSIEIPSSVKSIGQYAFYQCTSLKSVTVPSSVTSVAKGLFNKCSGITSANVLCGNVGENMFYECTNLTDVTLSEDITSIGMSAFYKCASIKSITIPDKVTYIGLNAFLGCTSLESIVIPKGVTEIDSRAFKNCTALKTLTMYNNNFTTDFGTEVFANCSIDEAYFDADKTRWDSKMREYTVNKVYYHTTDADKAVTEYKNEKDKATGFVATIKSDYEYANTEMIDKLMWRITSGGKTVNAATALDGAIELETGASATFGIVLDGLYDADATATVSAEDVTYKY